MTMTQGKDVIYVNGDSFTEGSDLDYHLLPFFERHYSHRDVINGDQAKLFEVQNIFLNKQIDFYNNNPAQLEQCYDYRKKMRWSSILSNILNKPVLNFSSQSGSSMYAICYRTLQDLMMLKRKGYDVTHIIIQLTGPTRISTFKETAWDEEPDYTQNKFLERQKYKIISRLLSDPSDIQHQALIASDEPLDISETRFIYELFLFKNAIENITDAKLIFVDSVFFKRTIYDIEGFTDIFLFLQHKHYLLDFTEKMKEQVELSMLDCIDVDEPDTITVGFHFTEKIHKKFAEKIAERYFK